MAKRDIIWRIYLKTLADDRGFKNVHKALRPLAEKFDKLGKMMPHIRYQWLSVMFAGMQLQRIFGGMVKSVASTTDAFAPMKLMLEDMLYPILVPLSDVLWSIFDVFDQLPDVIKPVGGVFIILLGVIGSFLAIVSQLGLSTGPLGALIALLSASGLFGVLRALIGPLAAVGAGIVSFLSEPLIIVMGILLALYLLVIRNWDKIKPVLEEAWSKVKTVAGNIFKAIKNIIDLIKTIPSKVSSIFRRAVDFVINAFTRMKNRIKEIWKSLESIPIIGLLFKGTRLAMGGLGTLVGGITRGIGGLLGFRQYGGFIPRTGLYMLHAGETVHTPGTGMTFAPNITIHATITQPMDVRLIADELERHWADKFGVRL